MSIEPQMLKSDDEAGYRYRGLILNEFVTLELALTDYITTYFLSDSNKLLKYEMTTIILDRLTFEHKRQSFKKIIDSIDLANGYVKTKSKPSLNKDFLNEIRKLIEIRNQFAHYFLIGVLTFDDIGETLILAEFRDGMKPISYTKNDLYELVDRIKSAANKISEMKKNIPTRQSS